jgi:hypothetical protein
MNNMKNHRTLLVSLFLCFGYLLLPGCSPGGVVLKNDDSIRKLNEMVHGSRVRVTTSESTYEGENLLVTRDSTTLEILTLNPKVVPFADVKDYKKGNGPEFKQTIQLKDDYIFNVRNVVISNLDSIVRFDAIIPAPIAFRTNDITKIQRWGHVTSISAGMAYGFLSGVLLGAVVGTVISAGTGGSSNSGTHHWEDLGTFLPGGIMLGGSLGLVVGAGIGGAVGQWDDIEITYSFEDKNP